MQFLRRSLTGLFLLALTLGALAYAAQMVVSAVETRMAQESRARPARERVFAANVVTIAPNDVAPVLRTFGEVRSRRTLDLRAKSSGTVIEMWDGFEEGARVTAGQMLFRVDPSDAQAAVETGQANLTQAQDALRDAERNLALSRDDLLAVQEQAALREKALERQQSVLSSGFGSAALVEDAELAAASARQAVVSRRQSLAAAEARLDQANTGLTRARIDLAEAQRLLDDTTIYAAFDGTLSGVSLVLGGLVTNNEQVGQLVDPSQLEVSFRISTPQYARFLDTGGRLAAAPVSIRLEAFGAEFTASGTLDRESAVVAEGQTGRLLYARLENARGFRPGDFVTVEVEEPLLRGVALVPASALDAGQNVLVVGEEERLQRVQVNLLRRQGDDVIIRAPDLAGRDIVAELSPLLGEGIKIRPVRPAAEGQAVAVPDEPEMLVLSPERRAALVSFIEGNTRMPAEVKTRMLSTLEQDEVPARMVERIEERMGG